MKRSRTFCRCASTNILVVISLTLSRISSTPSDNPLCFDKSCKRLFIESADSARFIVCLLRARSSNSFWNSLLEYGHFNRVIADLIETEPDDPV
ncbi:hypothetical protein BJX64DRAFT_270108 [Aspergillus heterothallicus]